MMFDNILIDGNNLFWISVIKETIEVMIEKSPIYVNGVRKALEYSKYLISKFGCESSKVYFLFDNPVFIHNIRKMYDEKYKHSREKLNIPQRFYDSLNIFIEILKNYNDNYYIVLADYLEADDLTYPILKKHKGEKSIIISNDLDWGRNCNKDTFWFNHKEIVNMDMFKEKYGFEPTGKKIQLYKAIVGDKADNVKPALPYLKKEKVIKIVNKFNNLEEFLLYFNHIDFLSIKDKEKIIKNKIILEKNYQLVDFILPDNVDDFIEKGDRDAAFLKEFYEILGFALEDDMYETGVDFFSLYKL